MIQSFEQLFQQIRQRPRKRLVIPAAEGRSILQACAEARGEGICDSILIGDETKLRQLLREAGISPDLFRVVAEPDPDRAVERAIAMIRSGEADMLMKGKTDTPTLLKAVLDGETGLRAGRVLSHVAVVEMPSYPRLMLFSDGGLNIRPDLEKKMDMIRNAVDLAHTLGNELPAVALLSATEKVNPKMEETLDYEKIVQTQAEQPFVRAVVDGPVAMDIALSQAAARTKEVESPVAGVTDIFITPDIASCNISVKALIYLAGAKASGLILGARVPIVLLSRADDAETKLRSIALGATWG